MKRKLLINMVVGILITLFLGSSYGYTTNSINVNFQDLTVDDKILVEGSEVYISLAAIEKMGYDVKWAADSIEIYNPVDLENEERNGSDVEIVDELGNYQGGVFNSKRSGLGTQAYLNGDTYIGQFLNDKIHGEGTYYFEIGGIYVGHFENGIKSGIGKRIYADGREYYGEWDNGLWNGYGSMIDERGTKIYALWENNRMIKYISKTQFKERVN